MAPARELWLGRRDGSFQFGLVFVEPAFEEGDRRGEVVVEGEQQVDVVDVFLAAEAVGEVVWRLARPVLRRRPADNPEIVNPRVGPPESIREFCRLRS